MPSIMVAGKGRRLEVNKTGNGVLVSVKSQVIFESCPESPELIDRNARDKVTRI